MKNRIVVTSGKRYLDIDAYAGCIAYARLLKIGGVEATAMTSATLNYSIPKSILSLSTKKEMVYSTKKIVNADYVLVDISDKKFFDEIVIDSRIIEIFDHHSGYTGYWDKLLGDNSHIEHIGAVCTLIYEQWAISDYLHLMEKDISKLLLAGIIDNTLNLTAAITRNRDIKAYRALLNYTGLSEAWCIEYFIECQKYIENNIGNTLLNDFKTMPVSLRANLPEVFAQLTIWDARKMLSVLNEDIINIMNKLCNEWVVNIIDIKRNKSILFAVNIESQRKLSKIFNLSFKNDICVLDRAWLRKEIIKKVDNIK